MSKLKTVMDSLLGVVSGEQDTSRGNHRTTKRAMLGRFSGVNRASRRAEEFKRLVAGLAKSPRRWAPAPRRKPSMRHHQRRAAARASRQAGR